MTNPIRQVLFVDDDPMVIHGIRRSTIEYEGKWVFFFALSGQEALICLAANPIDVLVTDMRMPGMDGIDLLEKVARQYPQVIRFVLSGNSEFSRMLQSTQLAHQFIPKPYDFEQIQRILERACLMRDLLHDPQLIRLSTGVVNLPSMPHLYGQLLAELQSAEPSSKRVGEIIATDVSMAAKILQLVNSAFFGLPAKVADPQRAVVMLGTNTIKALVLGIQIFGEYQNFASPHFSNETLWMHSLRVGQLTQKIAQQAGLAAPLLEDCQVVGLLHDIGKLLELRIPQFFQRCQFEHGYVTLESELQVLGTTHAQLGAYLLGIWGLPDHIVEAIAFHHQPAQITPQSFCLTTALHIANGLHFLELTHQPAAFGAAIDLNYLQRIGVTIRQLKVWADICRELTAN